MFNTLINNTLNQKVDRLTVYSRKNRYEKKRMKKFVNFVNQMTTGRTKDYTKVLIYSILYIYISI